MFMVLSSWQSHCESSPGSFDECRTAPNGRRPKTKPDDLGCESACTGCQNLHPPSSFIITTQPESWYSFYHPTESRRLLITTMQITHIYRHNVCLRVCRTCCLEPPSRSHSSPVYTCKTFEKRFYSLKFLLPKTFNIVMSADHLCKWTQNRWWWWCCGAPEAEDRERIHLSVRSCGLAGPPREATYHSNSK